MTLVAKPFITVYGVDILCEQIERRCIPSLAMEPTEWIRSGGSEFRTVHVDIDCRKFQESKFLNYGSSFLDCPLFHLFIIREDEELYNNENKELFSRWIGTLRSRSIYYWNILVLPNEKMKTINKFTISKFSIINRIKFDCNVINIEKQILRVSDDCKDQIDEIQKLIRQAVLKHYDQKCYNNEDKIRSHREMMYTAHWNYFDYFILQEELADVYECLSLYDEALAQFEESNYLFSQCLYKFPKQVNSPTWITEFAAVPFDRIDCLILTNYSDPGKRMQLAQKKLCLADFRAYLLSRQCALLQMLNRYKEIPSKVYSTLLEFLVECKLLQLQIDPNLKHAWTYLTASQALQRFNPIDCDSDVAQSYASLLRLALTSINKLAHSLQVWQLSVTDWSVVDRLKSNIYVLSNEDFGDTPSSQLNVAFKSREDFRHFHQTLCEETITIWKHVNRIRSANMLGSWLADLFFSIHEFEKAEPLYMRAIKCLRDENWAHVAMPLRLKLAQCQMHQFDSNPDKYLKTCIHLAGATFSSDKTNFNPKLSLKNRTEHANYFAELSICIDRLYEQTHVPRQFRLEPLFKLRQVSLLPPHDSAEGLQTIQIIIQSFLPHSVDVGLMVHASRHHEVDFTLEEQSKTDMTEDEVHDIDLSEFPIDSAPSSSSKTIFSEGRKQTRNANSTNGNLINAPSDNGLMDVHLGSSLDLGLGPVDTSRKVLVRTIEGFSTRVTCYPKLDAGLRCRKMSLSRDTGLLAARLHSRVALATSLNDELQTKQQHSEGFSRFLPVLRGAGGALSLPVGVSTVTLQSEMPGFFLPSSIEIYMFGDKAIAHDNIIEEKLDETWSNRDLIEKLLPNFEYDDNDTIAFADFENALTARVRIGLLSMPMQQNGHPTVVELTCLHDQGESMRQLAQPLLLDDAPTVLPVDSVWRVSVPLLYRVTDDSTRVTLRLPGVVRKKVHLRSVERIHISEGIVTAASSGKFVIMVNLQKPASETGTAAMDTFQIRNPALRLYHRDDVAQLLHLVHRSLSQAKFTSNSNLVLLWLLDASDVKDNDEFQLRFTLNLDVTLERPNLNLEGSVEHHFQLSHFLSSG